MYDDGPDRGRKLDPWSESSSSDDATLDYEPPAGEEALRRMERRAARERGRRRLPAGSSQVAQRPRESERRSRAAALIAFLAVAVVLVVAMVAWGGGDEANSNTVETVPVKLVPVNPEFLREDGSSDAGDWSSPAVDLAALYWSSV